MTTVTLSLFAGAGAQFLDNSGNVLTGGLIYTYSAGTTTPLATYASNLGTSAHPNPIVLDASGRVPGGEIWLTTGYGYKFVLKDANNVLIGTYDNIPSVALPPIFNDASSISYEQGYTVTAGSFKIGSNYLITSIGSTNFQSIGATSNTVGVLFTATGVGTGTGTAQFSRTVQNKLQESISVKDFGAVGDGSTDDTTAIQNALNNKGNIFFPSGNYKITSSLTFGDNTNIIFSKNSKLIAGVNNLTMFLVSSHAYYSQIRNATLDGNGYTNIIGFDLTNFRLQSGLYDCFVNNMQYGVIVKSCFCSEIFNFGSFTTPNPIRILNNNSGINIFNPNLDNSTGGSNTGNGVYVDTGTIALGSNIGVIIQNGFIQGFTYGVLDQSLATKIENTYFEGCLTADIFCNSAIDSIISGTTHYGAVGAVAVKAKNSDAISVLLPTMGSGARTQVLDFDTSNTNCVYFLDGSVSSINYPLGVTTGINSLPIQIKGTFTPTIVGTTTAGTGTYTVRNGIYCKIGNMVNFSMSITWTAHTGTGSISITGLPATLAPLNINYESNFPTSPLFAFTGPIVYTQLNGVSTNMTCVQVSTSGVASFIPLPSSGTLNISGCYNIIAV